MRWIGLAVVLVLSLLIVPLAAAQQVGKVYRLGILSPAAVPDPSVATSPNLVPLALRELGYIDGQNLVVERRFAEGKRDRLRGLARELVQLRVDVIVAVSDEAVQAAKDATGTIPIVTLLRAALGFAGCSIRQGFDLQLTQYDDRGWRATFYTTGMEHSPTSATGTAWDRTPWRATQRAAWALRKYEARRAH